VGVAVVITLLLALAALVVVETAQQLAMLVTPALQIQAVEQVVLAEMLLFLAVLVALVL
jgi:hypothetical protein